jgi:PAS domain S-box-containing protein
MVIQLSTGELRDRKRLTQGRMDQSQWIPSAGFPTDSQPAHPLNQLNTERNQGDYPGKLYSLINNLPGIAYRYVHSQEWLLEFVSEGCFELTGYSSHELGHGKLHTLEEFIHPDDRSLVWEELETALKGNKSFDIAYRIITAGGDERWVRDIGRGVFLADREVSAVEGFITDITDRKLSEKRIQSQVQRFEALRKIDIAITASFDLRVTLDVLLEQVTDQLEVDAADILLFHPDTRSLEYSAGRGFHTSALQHTRLNIGEGFAGVAALEQRIVHIPDLSKSLGKLEKAYQLNHEKFVSYFGVPLIAKGQIKGILEIFHRISLAPNHDWMEFLEALAGQAAIAIDNATLFSDLQRSNLELSISLNSTLEGWSKALELRDQETEGHTQRVTELTLRLAKAMNVVSSDLLNIEHGALLHDIGKMGIPDNILLKPGPLTAEEWKIMRLHPIYAYKLLYPIANLRPAVDIPYCHHEKWDGTGYPRGLKGRQIPLSARIFAVVDVWDALNSDRPYRPAWPKEAALNYIKEQSGRHFEPDVVDAFLKLIT